MPSPNSTGGARTGDKGGAGGPGGHGGTAAPPAVARAAARATAGASGSGIALVTNADGWLEANPAGAVGHGGPPAITSRRTKLPAPAPAPQRDSRWRRARRSPRRRRGCRSGPTRAERDVHVGNGGSGGRREATGCSPGRRSGETSSASTWRRPTQLRARHRHLRRTRARHHRLRVRASTGISRLETSASWSPRPKNDTDAAYWGRCERIVAVPRARPLRDSLARGRRPALPGRGRAAFRPDEDRVDRVPCRGPSERFGVLRLLHQQRCPADELRLQQELLQLAVGAGQRPRGKRLRRRFRRRRGAGRIAVASGLVTTLVGSPEHTSVKLGPLPRRSTDLARPRGQTGRGARNHR